MSCKYSWTRVDDVLFGFLWLLVLVDFEFTCADTASVVNNFDLGSAGTICGEKMALSAVKLLTLP